MTVKKFFHFIILSSLILLSSNAYAEVARSTFTTGIESHEPIDSITQAKDDQVIYYFTDLRNLTGHTILHLWDFNGKQYAVIPFEVKSKRWRVYSLKTLPKSMTGNWLVTVFDQTSGKILAQDSLPVMTTIPNKTEPQLMPASIVSPVITSQSSEKLIVEPSTNKTAKILKSDDSDNKEMQQQLNSKQKQNTPPPSGRLPIWDILPR